MSAAFLKIIKNSASSAASNNLMTILQKVNTDTVRNVSCTLPVSVASDPRLTVDHYKVLLALSSFSPGSSRSVTCTRDDLAERSGLFTSAVSMAVSVLTDLGLVKKTVLWSDNASGKFTCTYELLF
jgi:DNA-binding MarR family transcriptional regulator